MTLLVRAAQSADGAALDALIGVLSPVVLHVVRALLGPGEPYVEDVVQEVLLAIVDALPSWRGEDTLLHFAVRIAARRATAVPVRPPRALRWANRFRGWRRSKFAAATLLGGQRAAELRLELLRTLFRELPEAEGETMLLRLTLGYSVDEIAQIASVPASVVRNRLRLAKEALRNRVEADPQWAEVWGDEA